MFEDPERDRGLRQFWLEPVRALAPGETAVGWQVDALPGRSVVRVLWPHRGHHLLAQPTHLTWEDAQGRRYTTDSGLAIIGDVDGGFGDPPGMYEARA